MHFNTNKLPFHSILLHPKAIGDFCGHFFNPYISFHLENKFDFFPNASTFAFIVDPCKEVFIFVFSPMPPFVPNLGFHFNLDVIASIFFPLIQVNVHPGNEVVERIDMSFMLGSQFRNLDFLRLMIRSWKMLTREVEE